MRDPSFPLRVTKLGKLRLVSRVEFLEWLRTHSETERHAAAAPANDVDDKGLPVTAAGVLGELGIDLPRDRR